jgi:hypothetical protein
MAVARFKLPADQLRIMSRMMKAAGHKHAARELERAANRPGLTAELGAREFKALHELAPWRADVADHLDAIRGHLEASEAREATRLRGPALGPAPHRSYHARLAHRNRSKEGS